MSRLYRLLRRSLHLFTRRERVNLTLAPLGVLLLFVTGYVVLTSTFASDHRSNVALVAAKTPLEDCGRGVPAEKCNPSLGPSMSTQEPPPQPIKPPGPVWSSPSLVNCGPTFFSSSTATALSDQFGTIDCFRFSNKSTWVLIGDGMSTDGSRAAPGGQIVARDTCASGDDVCLDVNSEHDFSSFVVSYPPLPSSYPARLEATFGGRLLYISDANCGLFTYDIITGKWHGHNPAVIDAIKSGTHPAAITAPTAASGNAAIHSHAPAATAACG
jgi:hypothetical protein